MTADGSSLIRIGLRFDLRIACQTATSVQVASLRAQAKQSIIPSAPRFAAYVHTNTDTPPRPRSTMRPSWRSKFIRPSTRGRGATLSEGAGKAGCPLHPRSVCRKWKHTEVTTGVGGSVRPSLRNGFNGFLRALVSWKSARMCERAVLTNRPSLDLSPFVLKGHRSLTGSEGQIRCLPQPEQLHGL